VKHEAFRKLLHQALAIILSRSLICQLVKYLSLLLIDYLSHHIFHFSAEFRVFIPSIPVLHREVITTKSIFLHHFVLATRLSEPLLLKASAIRLASGTMQMSFCEWLQWR
jgi:hypothetical protein